jgi:hypothetical protein
LVTVDDNGGVPLMLFGTDEAVKPRPVDVVAFDRVVEVGSAN